VLKRLFVPLALTGLLAAGATSVGLSGTAYASTVTANVGVAGGGIPGWIKAHRAQLARAVVSISAETIGLTPRELVSDLRSGESIAGVANGHGVNPQTVETALVNAGDTVVAKALNAHKISSAQASAIDAALPGRVSELVNHVF
jgi:hypothetical protein